MNLSPKWDQMECTCSTGKHISPCKKCVMLITSVSTEQRCTLEGRGGFPEVARYYVTSTHRSWWSRSPSLHDWRCYKKRGQPIKTCLMSHIKWIKMENSAGDFTFQTAFYHSPGSAVLCGGGDAICTPAPLTDTNLWFVIRCQWKVKSVKRPVRHTVPQGFPGSSQLTYQ